MASCQPIHPLSPSPSSCPQDDQRSVQSVCRLQIDCTEQGRVDEGLARGPRSQAKPPSVAEARCCPLVIIPRRLSYHRRWALAPSLGIRMAVPRPLLGSWSSTRGSGSGSRLFFPSSSLWNDDWTRHPSPASTTLLAGAHSMHGIGPHASCMPSSVALALSICSRPAHRPTHPYPYQ